MESEARVPASRIPPQLSWVNLSRTLILSYQSFGVVYGDLSTSPLYVYSNTFDGKLHKHVNEDTIFGVFSLIFWTITFIPLLKYIFIVLSADDNGEGGTFALYTLLCRHAKLNLLPNQQADDEQLSSYKYAPSSQADVPSPLKSFLEKHRIFREGILIVVLFGACMVIGDGMLTPAISVLASISGLRVKRKTLMQGELVLLASIMLIGLFALQHYGTHKVAFVFAPMLIIWLISIFTVGLYNTIFWNPRIVYAISPHYILRFFRETGMDGWSSLGGILLCSAGAEAMFSDLGHFTALSIRLAFAFVIYPCLVVQYMGQAAFLSKNLHSVRNSFYDSIPEIIYWPIFFIAILATVVGSQAGITATFSIIKQCHALGCFPRIKVVHTSKHICGQIYIPEANWILMILTLASTIRFQDTTLIGNAYGLAFGMVTFVNTYFMALVIVFVWNRSILLATVFLLFFWAIEGLYLSAVLMKVPQGGWFPLGLSFLLMLVMYVWYYGSTLKYSFDLENKASLKWVLGLGPTLGIVRVPGIGLIYSELATGVPAIFSHFVTHLPAFHKVLIFVCVKSIPVPHVSPKERFLIARVCPRPYRMYRCMVRYGYKDIQSNDGDFENQLVQRIAEFIIMESMEPQSRICEAASLEGDTTALSRSSSSSSLIALEPKDVRVDNTTSSSLQFDNEDQNLEPRRRQLTFQHTFDPLMDPEVKEELSDLVEAKESGVTYIIGHTNVFARSSSSFLKKLVIDIVYSFLRRNCRGTAVALNIPHISLIEVGMIYYV